MLILENTLQRNYTITKVMH